MLQTVQCPHCGRKLAIDAKHAGTSVVCPLCKASFTPRAGEQPEALPIAQPEDRTTTTAAIRHDEPRRPVARPVEEDYATPGRDFADECGIDVDEEHFESVSGQAAAERRYQDWRDDMPEVPSAYQPSGKLPIGGVIGLSIGTLLGAVGGALSLLLIGVVVIALTVAIVALIVLMSEACGRVFCVLYLLAIVVGLVGGAVAFAVHGWVAAMITTASGIAGKNRNVPAAVVASVISCVLGLGLALFVADWGGDRLLQWLAPEEAAKQAEWTWVDGLVVAGIALGCVLAIIAAVWCGRSMVRESKFCEDCEEYMEEQVKRGVGLGAAKALVEALNRRRFDAAADLLKTREEKCAVPTLHYCPKCEKGYLEVQAKFKCHWTKDKEQEEKEEEWLAASAELEPEDVALFRERPKKKRDDSDD